MKLYSIESGNIKLDGGAMFGVVPKVLWEKTNPADELNRIDINLRLLLIEDANRLVLIDTGMGNKQPEKFFQQFAAKNIGLLSTSLQNIGFSFDDITDVFLTHLHFDHVGGAIIYDTNGQCIPAFKNATYWSNEAHWQWATQPNPREKASFLTENILPIATSEQLHYLPTTNEMLFLKHPELNIDYITINGHTEKQMLPQINYKSHTILYVADLIPTLGHLKLPYVMGYDVRPLQTLIEKKYILDYCIENDVWLFFEHDPQYELAKIQLTEKGYTHKQLATLIDL